jgi:ABC-type transport system involved in multi-copper enzyme maturation permease subunit
MSQTLAIFVDQYRALKARKMFWIVLGISGLVVLAIGAIGINDKGLTLLGWSIGFDAVSTRHVTQAEFYKSLFSGLGIGFWLSWLASLLALISTAGIFPEFVSNGVIDLTLSKPISRVRLFLTQYLAGLLFVTFQVGIFCLASFLVLGLRAGVWEPWLFLAVPLVVCFFSYLFSFCVLLGVLTRSTVAAILLTLLFWFCLYVLNKADGGLVAFKVMEEQRVVQIDKQLSGVREQLRRAGAGPEATTGPQTHPASGPASGPATSPAEDAETLTAKEARLRREREEHAATAARLGNWSRGVYYAKTFLPKTSETISLLERAMTEKAGMPAAASEDPDEGARVGKQIAKEFHSRSVAWVLGTSLAFEAAILALACFVFCRRDY